MGTGVLAERAGVAVRPRRSRRTRARPRPSARRAEESDRCRAARITQEELSGTVDTTRSRVGYFLKRFCQAGLVSRDGGCFLVVNEERLHDFVMREPSHRPPRIDAQRRQPAAAVAA